MQKGETTCNKIIRKVPEICPEFQLIREYFDDAKSAE
jgi:hypothetical protein